MFGRTYRVTAQADLPFRNNADDLTRIKVRNAAGDMVPLGNVATLVNSSGADRVPRYNLYTATEVNGDTLPSVGAAFGVSKMEELAKRILPAGINFEWTDLSYQQVMTGNAGLLIFPLCVLFVYLVLAAQYANWSLPISILLIVPMCLLAGSPRTQKAQKSAFGAERTSRFQDVADLSWRAPTHELPIQTTQFSNS